MNRSLELVREGKEPDGDVRFDPFGLLAEEVAAARGNASKHADKADIAELKRRRAAAGRERDLIVIKPGGPCGIDFLSPLRWDGVKERVRAFGMLCDDGKGPEASVQTEIMATHGMWRDLDHRTGSILRSMAGPLLARLNAPVAHSVFGAQNAVDVAEAVAAGKIVVLSIDGMREPAFARLAGTVFKGQFYDAVLRRAVWRADGDVPLSGLVLDDWALSADGSPRTRHSDTDALAMLRSRGGFVLAGCQSLAGLDLAVGAAARCAALANFNNLFFMRSRDTALDLLAANYLGERSTALVDRVSRMREEGDIAAREVMRYERETRGPAVPVGALSRLPVGEAYALIGGEVHAQPICLVPFYDPPG